MRKILFLTAALALLAASSARAQCGERRPAAAPVMRLEVRAVAHVVVAAPVAVVERVAERLHERRDMRLERRAERRGRRGGCG